MSVKRYSPGCCPQEPMNERQCGRYVEYSDYVALKEENDDWRNIAKAIRKANEQLSARVAELEKEDTLWAMLDAIEKALLRRAAPHAWEAVVTEAGMKFITDRRQEPANEG